MMLCLLGFGAPLSAADLVEVYRLAQQQDATFAAAKAAREAGIEALPQGRSTLLPTVGLNASRTHNKYGGAGMDMEFIGRSWGLTLTQPLFNWQHWAQYKQGEAAARQAEVQFAAAQQDLMVRAAQAYFDVLLAQDNVELQRAQKAAIAEQLEQAKISFEVGTATITDANNAQASYDLVNSQEIAAVNDLEVKRRTLQVLIGQYPELLKPLAEKLPLTPPEPAAMDAWVERADLQNLQVLAQQEGYEMAKQAVEINRAGHIPSLDLVAGRSQSDTALTGMPTNGTVTADQVGVQVNIPIFQGGYVSSKVRQAAANFEQAKQNLEYAKRQADLLARQSFLGVTNGIAQVKALEQALVSNQSSLDSTVLGQEVGVRTSVDVLNARQQLYNAKYNLAQARYNYVMSRLKLKSAVGTLSEDDLVEVNRWLVEPPPPSSASGAENPALAVRP
jgi:outer membrane protein